MKRLTSAILMTALIVSNSGLFAHQLDAVQRTGDYWYAYASKLPIGSTVRVRTSDGKRQTAVLTLVDQDSITVQAKTRVPEPPRRIRFDQLDQLELKENGSGVAKAVAIGIASGVGTFFGILLLIAANWD